jgi:RNA polymerase sigma-70 factor (ECF subfamily)
MQAAATVRWFETETTTLLDGAARAGVGHVVALSIVGIHEVDLGYYHGKRRQEELLLADSAPVPTTVLRATQFHEFAGQVLARMRGPIALVPVMRSQPIAAREVGAALVELAEGPAIGLAPELAGPQVKLVADMARPQLRAIGSRMSLRTAEELAVAYAGARARLVRVAYAVLGSIAEAEDVVSDCWLRLVEADTHAPVLDVDAWATVVVARRALDVLRSVRIRRESYVGPWLPEPVLAAVPDSAAADPAERTAWVLHDLFGLPFTEVAGAVGRSPDAVRQLASRARRHVADQAPRIDVDAHEHQAVFDAFVAAAAGGDLAALVAVLDPEAVLTSDGGGQVNAALRPVHGADRVARFLLGIMGKAPPGQFPVPVLVNGLAGLAWMDGDRIESVVSVTVQDRRISRVDMVRAPARVAALRLPGA